MTRMALRAGITFFVEPPERFKEGEFGYREAHHIELEGTDSDGRPFHLKLNPGDLDAIMDQMPPRQR